MEPDQGPVSEGKKQIPWAVFRVLHNKPQAAPLNESPANTMINSTIPVSFFGPKAPVSDVPASSLIASGPSGDGMQVHNTNASPRFGLHQRYHLPDWSQSAQHSGKRSWW